MLQKQNSGDCSEIMTKVCNVADRIIQNRLDTGKSAPFAVQLTNELKADYHQLNNLFLVKYDMSPDGSGILQRWGSALQI